MMTVYCTTGRSVRRNYIDKCSLCSSKETPQHSDPHLLPGIISFELNSRGVSKVLVCCNHYRSAQIPTVGPIPIPKKYFIFLHFSSGEPIRLSLHLDWQILMVLFIIIGIMDFAFSSCSDSHLWNEWAWLLLHMSKNLTFSQKPSSWHKTSFPSYWHMSLFNRKFSIWHRN